MKNLRFAAALVALAFASTSLGACAQCNRSAQKSCAGKDCSGAQCEPGENCKKASCGDCPAKAAKPAGCCKR